MPHFPQLLIVFLIALMGGSTASVNREVRTAPSQSGEPNLLANRQSAVRTQANEKQTPSQSRQLTIEPIASWPSKSKRWALVIGVDKYRDAQISSLKGSENDALMFADALVRYAGVPTDQVILLATNQPEERQPTRVNILRRLSNLASVVPKDGLLIVSFAGHGMERNSHAYLLPTDAQISDDISFLEETAISVTRLKERIRATGVGQVVILLDACRNDPGGRSDAPNPLTAAYTRAFNFDVRNREVEAFATLYATAVGERAYEYTEKRQGYFTWAVVEGLKGGAANEKGEVTLSGLLRFIQQTVPKQIGIDLGSTRQQKPFAVIEGYRAEDLVIAIVDAASSQIDTGFTKTTAETTGAETIFWDSIKNSSNPSDFQAYLEKFPNGMFAELAKRRAQPAVMPTSKKASIPPGWVTLNSAEGRFSIAMPELARDQAETKSSPTGPYTTHLFMAKTNRGVFLVGWVDYNSNYNFTVQSELEANRDNFVKGLRAKLLNSRQITFNGYQGLEFTAETRETTFISRVYIIGRRPYQLIAGTNKGQDDSFNVSNFLDSFQITDR